MEEGIQRVSKASTTTGGSTTTITTTTTTTTTSSGTAESNDVLEVPYFVCVDCESWERNHAAITEIGVATLDMGAVLAAAPAEITYDFLVSHITHRHLRIREHKHLKNGRFVPDAADLFEFGKSEFVSLKGVPAVLAEMFTPPAIPDNRVVVFVGHAADQDIKYLLDCGFDPSGFVQRLSLEGVAVTGARMEVLDTAEMYRAATGRRDTRGLGKMLVELGLDPWRLHNAGNDAGWTLRGLVKIAEGGAWEGEGEVEKAGKEDAGEEGSASRATG
ncbi:hypothetical protein BDZ91DRAFT_693512 [Kalaharituber pfeilii]|nr:hypothetical protein BDZ91DRAFT_693512 [Kalaharituber pfeilii]